MIKTINGKEYDLTVTRKGIRQAEAVGMNMAEFSAKPITACSYLWYSAIYGKQPMSYDKALTLFDAYLDSEQQSFESLTKELSEEYAKVFGLAVE